jgi:DNA-binding response OmpR family regulator
MGKSIPQILVVDDDADLINILKVKLESEGFIVLPALDAESALHTLRRVPVDLILLDIMMPRVSGFDFLRAVAKEPSLRGSRVMLLTAAGSSEQINEGLSLGAIDYVIKPFSFPTLLEKIRSILPKA